MALTDSAYDRAVATIESVSWRGMKPGLERTDALLNALGDPHLGLRGVLVAGTNGKGSVCALTDSVLRAAGLHTVLLTKPHLQSYRERIVIDGNWIDEEVFARTIETVDEAAASLPQDVQPTGFELLTVAGIVVAAEQRADAVVCEVGLGGRLDSTNVLDLGVAAVTTVGLDHQEHLGNTVTAIAREKAAIIKPGDAAVTGATEPALQVIRRRCGEVGAELTAVERDAVDVTDHGRYGIDVTAPYGDRRIAVHVPLLGRFQGTNVAVSLALIDQLRNRFGFDVTDDAVRAACTSVRWRGRMQWIEGAPPLLVDGAHNPDGMRALAATLQTVRGQRRVVAVFAAMRDKDVAQMAATLQEAKPDAVIVTAPDVQRASDPVQLAACFAAAQPLSPVAAALDAARQDAGHDGLVVVCGSLFLVGEVLTLLGS